MQEYHFTWSEMGQRSSQAKASSQAKRLDKSLDKLFALLHTHPRWEYNFTCLTSPPNLHTLRILSAHNLWRHLACPNVHKDTENMADLP